MRFGALLEGSPALEGVPPQHVRRHVDSLIKDFAAETLAAAAAGRLPAFLAAYSVIPIGCAFVVCAAAAPSAATAPSAPAAPVTAALCEAAAGAEWDLQGLAAPPALSRAVVAHGGCEAVLAAMREMRPAQSRECFDLVLHAYRRLVAAAWS